MEEMSSNFQAQVAANREMAGRLIERSLKSEGRKQQDDLLKTLGHSAVAARLAIAYIKSASGKTGQEMKIDQYLKLYKEKKSDHKIANDSKTGAILVALRLSLDAIEDDRESGSEAVTICLLIAYLALDKPIPWNIFLGILCELTPTTFEKILKALELLTTYGIVFYESGDNIVEIDCSIQEVIRAYFDDSEEAILEVGLELFDNLKLEAEVVFHAMALWNHASKYGALVDKYHRIIWKIIDALNRYIRDSKLLVRFGMKQFGPLEKHLGPCHEVLLRLKRHLIHMMPCTVKSSGTAEARELFRDSVAILDNKDPDMEMAHSFDRVYTAINPNADKSFNVFQVIFDDYKKVSDGLEKLVIQIRDNMALIQYEMAKDDGLSRVIYAEKLRATLGDLDVPSEPESNSKSNSELIPVPVGFD